MPKKVLFSREDYFRMLDNILELPGQPNLPEDMPLVEKILKRKGVKTPGLPRLPKV